MSCSNCGRPICPDCMTPTPVGMRCPECSRQRTRVRTARNISAEPTVTYVLIAINVIIFIGELATGVGAVSGGLGGSWLIEHGALSRFTVAQGDCWRLVTSGFLHAEPDPHRAQHVHPLHAGADARAGDRQLPLRADLLRGAPGRVLRGSSVHPGRPHCGRLRRRVRAARRRRIRDAQPRHRSVAERASRCSSASTWCSRS